MYIYISCYAPLNSSFSTVLLNHIFPRKRVVKIFDLILLTYLLLQQILYVIQTEKKKFSDLLQSTTTHGITAGIHKALVFHLVKIFFSTKEISHNTWGRYYMELSKEGGKME